MTGEQTSQPVLRLTDVSHWYEQKRVLNNINWSVFENQHWVVLGPNGCGKSTLLQICSLYLHPSTGMVTVMGETLGQTDVRSLRRRIGYMSAALAEQLRAELTPLEIVYTAKYAALEPWWHDYNDTDFARARQCLDQLGVGWCADRSWSTLSSGERQRVLLARTLMNDPKLVLLDEPTSRLDLRGREELVAALADLARTTPNAASVLVTHHVEEIPVTATHLLLLRDGNIVTIGDLATNLNDATLSECFQMPFHLEQRNNGRFTAWATQNDSAG